MSGFSNNSNLPLLNFEKFQNQSSTLIDIFDRRMAANSAFLVSGTIFWTFFTPVQSATVTGITMSTSNTASAGLTLCRLGLYTFDETTAVRVAQTATDTTLFNATFSNFYKAFDNSVASSYPLIAGNMYGVAVIAVGTTMPNLVGIAPVGLVPTLTPKLSQQLVGQADLLASNASFSNTNNNFIARLT